MFRKLLLALFLFTEIALFAQTSQSPFSRSGIGAIENTPLLLGKQLGGALTAVRSKSHINSANPASYSAIDTLNFIAEFGASFHLNTLEQNGNSTTNKTASFDYLAMMFPVSKWWGSSISLSPMSNTNYDIQYTEKTAYDSLYYNYKGYGGLRKATLGNSFAFFDKSLSIGANLSYIWGNNEYESLIEFAGNNKLTVVKEAEIHLRGFAADFGLQYEQKLPNKKNATIGLTYSPGYTLKGETMQHVEPGDFLTEDTLEQGNDIPSRISVGIGFGKRNKYMFYADYAVQDWSNTILYGESADLNNYSQISAGAEISGWSKKIKPSYRRTKFRFGMYLADTYTNVYSANGSSDQLRDLGMTFGMGLPIFQSRNNINFACKFGQRSTGAAEAINETYLQFHINMTLQENWFFKRKFD